MENIVRTGEIATIVTSNFSFSQNVFHRYTSLVRQNAVLCGYGLKQKVILGWVLENIAGKGENAGYQHFLLFPQCFQKAYFCVSLKVGIVW